MSAENVEIVRRAFEAWNGRDVEGMLALADPEIEYVNSPTAVESGTRRGHEGLSAVFEAQWEILGEVDAEIERIHDRGDDIITVARLSRAMPGSEARVADVVILMWSVRDGKLVRVEVLGQGTEAAEIQSTLEDGALRDSK